MVWRAGEVGWVREAELWRRRKSMAMTRRRAGTGESRGGNR